jgi:hypothetical protein
MPVVADRQSIRRRENLLVGVAAQALEGAVYDLILHHAVPENQNIGIALVAIPS